MLKQLFKNLKHLIKTINMYGVPLPMVRDPKTGAGSVSLTLVVLSSLMVILGCIGEFSGRLDVDVSHALEFFYASSALYFGRNWKKGGASQDLADEDSSELPKVEKNSGELPPTK